MSTEAWKVEKDLCRCCHSEGSFKSVYERYLTLDIQEMMNKDNVTLIVYSDMLRECFDIELAPVTEALNHTASAICDACIQRLRDATQFKHQVRECERRFRDQYLKHVEKASPFEVDVKLEVPDPEQDACDDVKVNVCHGGARNDHGSITAQDGRKADEDLTSGCIGLKVKSEEDNIFLNEVKKAKLKKEKPKKGRPVKAKLAASKVTERDAARPPDPSTPSNNDETEDTGEVVIEVKTILPFTLTEDIDYKRVAGMCQCCKCEYKCKDIKTIKNHVKTIHLNIPQHTCSHCSKTFPKVTTFLNHKLDEHNIDDRFKCNACDSFYYRKHRLQEHIRSFHMLGEKHKCDVCDYETYRPLNIKRHKKVHDNVKSFNCKYCRKSFKRRSTLQCHERIHTGDKRKVCQECGQAFVQKASLNYHMTKYHPEVNF